MQNANICSRKQPWVWYGGRKKFFLNEFPVPYVGLMYSIGTGTRTFGMIGTGTSVVQLESVPSCVRRTD